MSTSYSQGSEEGVRLERSPDQTPDGDKVLYDVLRALDGRPLVTVRRDGVEELLDGVGRGDKLLALSDGSGLFRLLLDLGLLHKGLLLLLASGGALTDRGGGHCERNEKSSLEDSGGGMYGKRKGKVERVRCRRVQEERW